MFIEPIIVGDLETNCYLVGNNDTFFLIDPGAEPEKIEQKIQAVSNKIKAIICTHGHYDHVGAIAYFQKKYKFPVWIHEEEQRVLEAMFQSFSVKRFQVDQWLKEGDFIALPTALQRSPGRGARGEFGLKVLHTPGHTPGGICLYNDELVITGDTLFADGYLGRTDLAGGSNLEIQKSLQRIIQLPENLQVYPGHGPASTIAAEKKLHHRVGNLI